MSRNRLHGISVLEDDRHSMILGNTLEVYADRHEAGFIVGSMGGGKPPERMVFRKPGVVAHIRNLIDLMRETAGLPSLDEPSEPHPLCVMCNGTGYWEDHEGNQRDCEICP